jgi:hypothetical protein
MKTENKNIIVNIFASYISAVSLKNDRTNLPYIHSDIDSFEKKNDLSDKEKKKDKRILLYCVVIDRLNSLLILQKY